MRERPQPGKCDKAVYETGEPICGLAGPRSYDIEDWIVVVREQSGQHVDWHFVGGRARILFLGDRAKVRAAIEATLPKLNEVYKTSKENPKGEFAVQFWWIGE